MDASSRTRRARPKWTGAAVIVLAAVVSSASFGIACHNTARGFKEDSKRAIDKTKQKLNKVGRKIEGK